MQKSRQTAKILQLSGGIYLSAITHFYESGSADEMDRPGICADALYLFRKQIKSYAEDWGATK